MVVGYEWWLVTMVMNGQSAALNYENHIKDLGVTFDEKLD